MTAGTTTAIAYADHLLPGIAGVVSVDIRVRRTLALYTKAASANAQEVARLRAEMCSDLNAAGLTAARIESIVSTFGSVIWETRAKGNLEAAITQTELALAIVPDEPRLLALLGETEKALGREQQARMHLERALLRGKLLGAASLDAAWTGRVEAALA